MSNILTNSLETKTYTLFLSSTDKVSGTNNSATFNVNWDAFLPREFDKVRPGSTVMYLGQKWPGFTLSKLLSHKADSNFKNRFRI